MPAELPEVRDFISANLSEGNARELALIFGKTPPDPVALCMAQSDHFHWFREGGFAGLAGMGQADPWLSPSGGCFPGELSKTRCWPTNRPGPPWPSLIP